MHARNICFSDLKRYRHIAICEQSVGSREGRMPSIDLYHRLQMHILVAKIDSGVSDTAREPPHYSREDSEGRNPNGGDAHHI